MSRNAKKITKSKQKKKKQKITTKIAKKNYQKINICTSIVYGDSSHIGVYDPGPRCWLLMYLVITLRVVIQKVCWISNYLLTDYNEAGDESGTHDQDGADITAEGRKKKTCCWIVPRSFSQARACLGNHVEETVKSAHDPDRNTSVHISMGLGVKEIPPSLPPRNSCVTSAPFNSQTNAASVPIFFISFFDNREDPFFMNL
jgi:hypothetical protein